jgi:LmbE family N-acetylglucosaminyl deacetylase
VILPYWKGRHPDHYTCSTLGYEACFLAGLKKLEIAGKLRAEGVNIEAEDNLPPYRPFKIVYATLYYDVRPTFVVDISEQFEARLAALLAYKSQFEDQSEGSGIFPAQQEIRDRIHSMARFYGLMAGVKYAEPFLQKEVGLVDDLLSIPVQSI